MQGTVHVADIGDLAIATIEKAQRQRVASPSADTNHRQHEPLIGRKRNCRTSIGKNRRSGGKAEGGLSGTLQEITPMDQGHTNRPSHGSGQILALLFLGATY
ncbi:MAG TPA: hypothetical protein PLQ00_07580 [Thermoguttaceae bacterium]|nr:hypothetical protein [Thermoguttaceae bacterium]